MRLFVRKIEKLILNKCFLPFLYSVYAKHPLEEDLVLFADSKDDDISVHMKSMYDKMIREGYLVENLCKDLRNISVFRKIKYMITFMKRYAVAKYVFICDYFIPISSCNKRQETKVIQLWHAGGMLKKFGYDAADDLGNLHLLDYNKNIDLWTVSSKVCVSVFEQACHLFDGQVQPLGIARTDIYHLEDYRSDCRENFYRRYPELEGKRLIVWAPTFRGNAQSAELVGFEEILQLEGLLGSEWKVLIKVHPHLADMFGISNCDIPLEKLYPVIDGLITDYSSVVFDMSIFGKPFYIYAPDYDTYMKTRGCYMDYNSDFPCKITKNLYELADEIRSGSTDLREIRMFCDKYMGTCDGQVTDRIFEYLRK